MYLHVDIVISDDDSLSKSVVNTIIKLIIFEPKIFIFYKHIIDFNKVYNLFNYIIIFSFILLQFPLPLSFSGNFVKISNQNTSIIK